MKQIALLTIIATLALYMHSSQGKPGINLEKMNAIKDHYTFQQRY